ncbi:MAG TPA: DUF892 family protein [Bryobacteraceae bacterium]|nr:DUF892 family protein [Bryobacteraceae bacterium]
MYPASRGDTSTLKDMAGKVIAFGQGMSGMFVEDEIVKGTMASYTFEHMEASAYRYSCRSFMAPPSYV